MSDLRKQSLLNPSSGSASGSSSSGGGLKRENTVGRRTSGGWAKKMDRNGTRTDLKAAFKGKAAGGSKLAQQQASDVSKPVGDSNKPIQQAPDLRKQSLLKSKPGLAGGGLKRENTVGRRTSGGWAKKMDRNGTRTDLKAAFKGKAAGGSKLAQQQAQPSAGLALDDACAFLLAHFPAAAVRDLLSNDEAAFGEQRQAITAMCDCFDRIDSANKCGKLKAQSSIADVGKQVVQIFAGLEPPLDFGLATSKDSKTREAFWTAWLSFAASWERRLTDSNSTPWRPEQLTAANIEWCLRQGGVLVDPSTHVSAVELATMGEGSGMNSVMRRVTVTYSSQNADLDPSATSLPSRVIAKLTPLPPDVDLRYRAGMRSNQMPLIEHRWYASESVGAGFRSLGLRLPRVYYSTNDDEANRSTLLMEDLSLLPGASVVDQTKGMTAAEARQLTLYAAKMHGFFWAREAERGMGWVESLAGPLEHAEAKAARTTKTWTGMWAEFERHPILAELGYAKGHPGLACMEYFAQHAGAFYQCWRTRSAGGQFPGTVTHADYRGDNFFVVDGGGDQEHAPIVVDWQTPRRSAAEVDVGEIIAGSLDTRVRRELEGELCVLYHSELCRSISEAKAGAAEVGAEPKTKAQAQAEAEAEAREYPLALSLSNFQLAVIYAARRGIALLSFVLPSKKPGAERDGAVALGKQMVRRGLDCLADWNCLEAIKAHISREGRPPTEAEALSVLPDKLRRLCTPKTNHTAGAGVGGVGVQEVTISRMDDLPLPAQPTRSKLAVGAGAGDGNGVGGALPPVIMGVGLPPVFRALTRHDA